MAGERQGSSTLPGRDPCEGLSLARVEVWQDGASTVAGDQLAAEQPVALFYRCVAHAVMMLTPGDLEDFAYGFSLSEGIIDRPEQLYDIEVREAQGGLELRMDLDSACLARLQQRRRQMVGASGCGLCGLETLAAVTAELPVLPRRKALSHSALQRSLPGFEAHQVLGALTGGMHAAAWCDLRGAVQVLREDVGRHNAFDKLIGALAREPKRSGFALLSSRASYELVQKALRADIEILVTLSAATSLAVELAERCGLTLVGFTRPGRHVVYSHPERLCPTECGPDEVPPA